MIFKEDWWVVPLIIILGFLLLYQICNPGNNSEDSSRSGNKGLNNIDSQRGSNQPQ